MYSLFAPQGSGKAESLTPLKRRTTPHSRKSESSALSAADLRVYDGEPLFGAVVGFGLRRDGNVRSI